MSYLQRGPRQRFDPRVHLPGAQSVVVCAHSYYSDPDENPGAPYVSIYSRGENYHFVVEDKLQSLCLKMRDLAGDVKSKIFVDSSPISEKSFAAKAGIGFIGRNGTMIIPKKRQGKKNTSFGSFYFLGIIITELKLEPDEPATGTCGKCRKCVEACPTAAIVGDGIIDSDKCISYHTTQNKGDIPEDIASSMGNMIFGCDICQLVCPYNSGISSSVEPRFLPDPELARPDIAKLLEITESEFQRRFMNNSIGEFKYDMFKRNLQIADKNIKSCGTM